MRRLLLALAIAILACGTISVPVVPQATQTLSKPVLASPIATTMPSAVVTAKTLNLREAPDTDAFVLTILKNGDLVTMTGESVHTDNRECSDWLPVSFYELDGWVCARWILTP